MTIVSSWSGVLSWATIGRHFLSST